MLTDEQGRMWELLCTRHNSVYSLSCIGECPFVARGSNSMHSTHGLCLLIVQACRASFGMFIFQVIPQPPAFLASGMFCQAHNLRPGNFLIFYLDCKSMLVRMLLVCVKHRRLRFVGQLLAYSVELGDPSSST